MTIQKLRIDRGWSQEDLAAQSGLSTRTIQRIENGKRASLESLKCLAAVFETKVADLVQEETVDQANPASQYFLDQAEREAIQYVQNLKAFHINWIAAVILLPFLYWLNIELTPQTPWILIVGAAWGFGVGMHALVIFGLFDVFGGAWEQREFQKRMNRRDDWSMHTRK